MRVGVTFQDDRLDLEVPDDRCVGVWEGPPGIPPVEVKDRLREALERPSGFPPLRQAVVPGDRVVIPIDPEAPEALAVVEVIAEVLQGAGVEPGSIEVLATGPVPLVLDSSRVTVWSRSVHDPDDRSRLAYLASTPGGRRIYLNRAVVDADFVVPVGRLGYD